MSKRKLILYSSITLLLASIIPLIIGINIDKTSTMSKPYSYHGVGPTHSFYVYLYGNDTLKLSVNVASHEVNGLLNISIIHVSSSNKYTTTIPLNSTRIPIVKFTAEKPGIHKIVVQFVGIENKSSLGVNVLIECLSGSRGGYRLYYVFLFLLASLTGLSMLAIYITLNIVRR